MRQLNPNDPNIAMLELVARRLGAEVLALSDYHRIEGDLRKRGFKQDMGADAPICRWQVDEVTVDVMPTMEKILGFSNCWHPLCVQTAEPLALPGHLPGDAMSQSRLPDLEGKIQQLAELSAS